MPTFTDAELAAHDAAIRAEQAEMDLAMHRAYRPEVAAELAVHLSEDADWETIAAWCGGTIHTEGTPSGEYACSVHIPGVGSAWQGSWIVQRHDLSFQIRAELDGPSNTLADVWAAGVRAAFAGAITRQSPADVLASNPYPTRLDASTGVDEHATAADEVTRQSSDGERSCGACWACVPQFSYMRVCASCGNKRCPHANNHRNACTGSNEPGQAGSAYPPLEPDTAGW